MLGKSLHEGHITSKMKPVAILERSMSVVEVLVLAGSLCFGFIYLCIHSFIHSFI